MVIALDILLLSGKMIFYQYFCHKPINTNCIFSLSNAIKHEDKSY